MKKSRVTVAANCVFCEHSSVDVVAGFRLCGHHKTLVWLIKTDADIQDITRKGAVRRARYFNAPKALEGSR